jgi:hypothetical protein
LTKEFSEEKGCGGEQEGVEEEHDEFWPREVYECRCLVTVCLGGVVSILQLNNQTLTSKKWPKNTKEVLMISNFSSGYAVTLGSSGGLLVISPASCYIFRIPYH